MRKHNPTTQHVPALSVLLPVYDAGDFLTDALRSVLEQSFANFELLVCDDGSTDDSIDIARAFAAVDERVRVFRRPHRGLVPTLNELVGWASAPLLARMDADDVCLPERFRNQVRFMRDNPGVVCLGGSIIFIDAAGRELGRGQALLDDAAIQHAAMQGRSPICHSAAILRRDALLHIGGYRLFASPAEDLDLILRLGEVGELANLTDDVLALRQHAGAHWMTEGPTAVEAARRACLDAAHRRGQHPTFAIPNQNPDPVIAAGLQRAFLNTHTRAAG